MRRIIVPLDGTELAERILPDALRVAGEDGELILLRDVSPQVYPPQVWEYYDRATWHFNSQDLATSAHAYLQTRIQELRARGIPVRAYAPMLNDVALSIDEAARALDADMIVCATHGRGPMGRVLRGGVAWRALAHSSVPIMLRHVAEQEKPARPDPVRRRILVPLDGSVRSETALPLAVELAREWNAAVHLIRVVADRPVVDSPLGGFGMADPDFPEDERKAAQEYLEEKGRKLPVEVHACAAFGSIIDVLLQAVREWEITDIVMASHGRTGLMRVIMGSVADALVHRLTCPIFVIPSLAAEPGEERAGARGVPAHA